MKNDSIDRIIYIVVHGGNCGVMGTNNGSVNIYNNCTIAQGDNSMAINSLSKEEADILNIYNRLNLEERVKFLKTISKAN